MRQERWARDTDGLVKRSLEPNADQYGGEDLIDIPATSSELDLAELF